MEHAEHRQSIVSHWATVQKVLWALECERQKRAKEFLAKSTLHCCLREVDPEKRLLCEMPLCKVTKTLTPPFGFQHNSFYVNVGRIHYFHHFYFNPYTYEVWDPTFAQLADFQVPHRESLDVPGSRVQHFQQKCTNGLIVPYSTQSFVLIGRASDIRTKLGIGYTSCTQ